MSAAKEFFLRPGATRERVGPRDQGATTPEGKPDTSELKPIVILDAAFASRANLDLLNVRASHYIINITRGSRRKYAAHFRNEAFEALPGRSADQRTST